MKTQKLFTGIIIFLLLLYSCKQQVTSTSTLVDMANRKFEAMNQHDSNAIAKLYADSAKIQSPNFDKPETGPAGIRSIYNRYFTSTPDMVYTITRILPGDSSVTVEYTFAGTMQHLEDSGPKYMLGKYYKLKACSVLEIRNGMIVSDVSYFDQVAFLKQVGFFDQH